MTPAHTDSPLRRSEVAVFRDGAQNLAVNDDDEERRQARRRTLLQTTGSSDSSTFEDNETLKKCLEIYNGNKLSRDNAWSLSLIDTLSALLDRHHKSLNNFKVAGSSLEASSKVYGLRVDSIHIDVLRLSAGLNAQKFSQKNLDDEDDDVATGGDEAVNPNSSATDVANIADKTSAQKSKPKRQRKAVSTITKNKETLNARLDTVPLQDPVFGKLNAIVGSINSSTRLMNNILLTTDAELRLRTNFQFWDSTQLEKCDYTEDVLSSSEVMQDIELTACSRLFIKNHLDDQLVRPLHSGYVISDTPEIIADDKDNNARCTDIGLNLGNDADDNGGEPLNSNELLVAFDLNAECEPMPELHGQTAILDVDYGDFDDLTTEERTAIKNCRGLRKTAVLIEDLRPVDASSQLEYSYRPLDKITQFWAGPSHWKFKRTRPRPSQPHSLMSKQDEQSTARSLGPRNRRNQQLGGKKRSKLLNFEECHDDLFIKLDNKYKMRKVNFQKKWDQRKLKLPTDFQLDVQMYHKYKFAPGLVLEDVLEATASPDMQSADGEDDAHMDSDHHFDDNFLENGPVDSNILDISSVALEMANRSSLNSAVGENDENNISNNTVLEIATDFEGAPSQVTKIIVPFAKRAKVIDMKSLKRCCSHLITKQMKTTKKDVQIPQHPIPKDEQYGAGMASFKELYNNLPELLSQNMAEALSPSVAFYSVLHLANDLDLRLIPQEDLQDFKIRQVML